MDTKNAAVISKDASIGKNTKVWYFTQIRENAKIGDNCVISKNCYIDHDVVIGDNVKIQNNSSIYYMAIIEDGVFIGPHVILTNDKAPRAVDTDGKLKTKNGWSPGKIVVKEGASIGAGSILLPDISIGKYSMVGAGSIVTKDVPDYGLVYGNPAKLVGYVDKSGKKVKDK
jgi:acetyltransferase-like isoleucine patch superfamily enzyme